MSSNKQQLKTRTIAALIIGSILFTLSLMTFGSHGSFNPTEIGFYTSIGAGLLWFIGMYFILKKTIKRKSEKDKSAP